MACSVETAKSAAPQQRHRQARAAGRSGQIAVWIGFLWSWTGVCLAETPPITPSPYWKNQISFQNDAFCSFASAGSTWIKFTILMEPYDPHIVYFQNSRKYKLHYDFASQCLAPFIGMSGQQFYEAAVTAPHPAAVLGTILLPPTHGTPPVADVNEYGIQLVRYNRQEIRDFFGRVRASVMSPPGVQALFFPTFEQQAAAQADRAWFESQGIAVGSMTRWAKGNACYSQGWALGRLKFFTADRINTAYQAGELGLGDILLTDGVPAEIPWVAGVLSLAPSTPNSHVAILSRTYSSPFAYLAVQRDADFARSLVGRRIILTAYENVSGTCETRLMDTEGLLDDAFAADILKLKKLEPLHITPMASFGAYGVTTEGLTPSDAKYVGGKAAGFGIVRAAVPTHSPKALALTFDLWNAFLDQSPAASPRLEIKPGGFFLIWADGHEDEGPSHAGFKLSAGGDSVALFDSDGKTAIDVVHVGPQEADVSYGRSTDGGLVWQSFPHPTPGRSNSQRCPAGGHGLVINECMADNKTTLADPCDPRRHPDWIELYNGSDQTVILNGLYLTDDVNDPTRWQIPVDLKGGMLREEIGRRLSPYRTYPPADILALSKDLAVVRSLFTSTQVTRFRPDLETAVMSLVTDPVYGFDPNVRLRFRSSTNVEDSADYTGAGLYESFSGCPGDDFDGDAGGPSRCDCNEFSERGALRHPPDLLELL